MDRILQLINSLVEEKVIMTFHYRITDDGTPIYYDGVLCNHGETYYLSNEKGKVDGTEVNLTDTESSHYETVHHVTLYANLCPTINFD